MDDDMDIVSTASGLPQPGATDQRDLIQPYLDCYPHTSPTYAYCYANTDVHAHTLANAHSRAGRMSKAARGLHTC
jgi:hypothetical protein